MLPILCSKRDCSFGERRNISPHATTPSKVRSKNVEVSDGFANHGCVWKIALERLRERWSCVNSIDVQGFSDQNLSDGETRPAA